MSDSTPPVDEAPVDEVTAIDAERWEVDPASQTLWVIGGNTATALPLDADIVDAILHVADVEPAPAPAYYSVEEDEDDEYVEEDDEDRPDVFSKETMSRVSGWKTASAYWDGIDSKTRNIIIGVLVGLVILVLLIQALK